MKHLVFAYPGDLDTPTGGYVYDRRIITSLEQLGWDVELLSLGEGFPFPEEKVLRKAEKRLLGLPRGARTVIDGLAYGVMDHSAPQFATHLDITALVHHPLGCETGLSYEQAAEFINKEQRSVQAAKRVIVTSPATAQQVETLFGVPRERIHVVVPGTEKSASVDRALVPSKSTAPKLLCVATVTRRKGYDLLVQALGQLADLDWHLDIVGATDRDPACFGDVTELIAKHSLEGRITFHGALPASELGQFYRSADIFVLASRYEGYGMAYTEALAHGLPVIGSGGGAVRQTLPEGASLYCETESVVQLTEALKRLIMFPQERMHFAQAAREAANTLPTWAAAAKLFASALGDQAERGRS
ncbi:glycosyl transferase, group 1 [Roseibium sp. TrichSKD4]|uniref:glycosyltransferase family 4 protein n=1 Tax=Roseibium sp. TrichSKD4 TaxID=744980 RepID=UPI0001E562DE|nr:glycosyltransferase family 4 protein [Roseibium sp. TrichSKD4]EFO33024.1 glycosyl transferase, group 1 [Roseibium sp. TrichSKD4]